MHHFAPQLPPNRTYAPEGGGSAPDASPATMPRLRVLLAEDNPTNQLVARRMLESMGHCVHLAGDGRQALEAVRAHQFDVILMDMIMPEMDGIAASRAIRAGGVDTNVPIVAVTANSFEHDRLACLEAGMNGFLSKPFNRTSLRAALLQAIQLRREPENDDPRHMAAAVG